MTIKQVLLSIIIFILPNRDSLAQVLFDDYTITTWNSKNGLPSELILDLTRDNDNFLWLSTYEGLFRFDGVQFKTFNNTTHAAFKTNNFYRPTVDKKNNLWIPTQFGAFLKLRGNGVKTISGMPKTNGAITKFENGEFLYMTSENEYLFLNPTTLKYRIKSLSDVAKQLRKETNSDIAANLPDGRMIMIDILRKIFMVEGDSIRLLFKAEGVKTDMNFTSNLLRTSLNEILIVHDNGLKIWKDNRLEIYPGTEHLSDGCGHRFVLRS